MPKHGGDAIVSHTNSKCHYYLPMYSMHAWFPENNSGSTKNGSLLWPKKCLFHFTHVIGTGRNVCLNTNTPLGCDHATQRSPISPFDSHAVTPQFN